MIKISYRLIVAGVFFLMIFFNSSCHKENTSFSYTQATETVSSYVEAQQMTDLLLNTYFKSITDSLLLNTGASEIDGANVSYTFDPPKITIQYPYSKPDGYGHYRKGIYEAISETGFLDSTDVVKISFENFYYDNDSLNIHNITIINKGTENANSVFSVFGSELYRLSEDSTGRKSYIKFQLQQEFVRHKDVASAYHTQNDYFSISGDLMGVARNSFTFSSSTADTNTLTSAYNCNWLKSGVANIYLPEFIYSSIADFSLDGECVNMYSIFTNDTRITTSFDSKD